MQNEADSLFEPGRNCWRVANADRLGWLVDAEQYFISLRESLGNARHEILILGWDIDSRTELVRDEQHPDYPSPLADTLESLVEAKPDLSVHLLSWDFAAVYMLERELMPARAFGWRDHERLHFRLDGQHPVGASHHQKVVIIDGCLAFSGGIDLTKARWDTRQHAPNDERRKDPDGNGYRPFHDVQAIVTGQPAANLRVLFAERWKNATGKTLPDLDPHAADESPKWPESAASVCNDVDVAIARTWTSPNGDDTVEEVQALYLDMIASARESIYVENQYLTSPLIADALANRLKDDDAPEIVIVMPAETSGWLEQATMEVLRNQAFNRLNEANQDGKLRIVSPVFDELGDTTINVHAKIMVADNRVARIGSANLSQRSMSLDTECDLVFEDDEAASRLAADLLAEHLGADIDDVHATLLGDGLLAVLDRFNDGPRRLDPLTGSSAELPQTVLEPVAKIADLEKPLVRAKTTADPSGVDEPQSVSDESSMPTPASGWVFAALVVVVLGVWIAVGVNGAGGDFEPRAMLNRLRELAAHPLAPWLAVPAFVAGSFVVAPVTAMIAACGLMFEPVTAVVTAAAGVLLSTVANHWVGLRFRDAISNRVPQSVEKRIQSIANASDMFSLAGLRLIPIAPFTVVNLVAGATGVKLRDFLAGTVIGMGPGLVLICLSVDRARAALSGEPVFSPAIVIAIAGAGAALIGMRVWQQRRR